MKNSEHIKFITKAARLEYQNENPEQGRTLFEGIVNNYPKRSDVWSVYFDCEIKHTSAKAVRGLFERCIGLTNLPLNKIKFFYKRYMDYESKHGTPKRLEAVKQKALAYVQSLKGEDDDEESNEAEEEEAGSLGVSQTEEEEEEEGMNENEGESDESEEEEEESSDGEMEVE